MPIVVVIITLLRVVWLSVRPLPHDIEPAIMFGLRRIRLVLARKVKVEGNAPYGILWYAMNLPISVLVGFDGRKWVISLTLLDSIFLWISQTLGTLGFFAYIFIGTFQLFRAPWNVTIDWIIMLGPFSWIFLLIAPIAKLPVGLPLHTFGDTSRGLFYQHNYIYYGLLGTLWLIVFLDIFLNTFLNTSVLILGSPWAILLGYLFLRRGK